MLNQNNSKQEAKVVHLSPLFMHINVVSSISWCFLCSTFTNYIKELLYTPKLYPHFSYIVLLFSLAFLVNIPGFLPYLSTNDGNKFD